MSIREWFGMEAKPDAAFEVTVPQEMLEGMSFGGTVAPRIFRAQALQVPAVMRGRNLICGTLAGLPLHIKDKKHNPVPPERGLTLLDQIDPDIPNVVTLAQTYEDILFEGVSWWKVLEIGWHGYPTFAERVHPSRIHVSGGFTIPVGGNSSVPVGAPMGQVYIDGQPVADNRVIRFDSPNPALLVHAARAIRTCLILDQTASSYAAEPIPLGFFTPKEGTRPHEDDTKIQGILDKWATARRARVWGYVPSALELKVLQFDAEQIQLAEQRQHAVLEIARAFGVDPEDLGVSTTSRTYQNSEQRRQDLIDFTMSTYMHSVEQRLSMGDVTPRGYEAKTSLDGFLRSDTKGRMEAYEIGKRVGAYTEDEIRELEDRPPLTSAERARALPLPTVDIPQNGGRATEEVR